MDPNGYREPKMLVADLPPDFQDLAVDPIEQKLYWAEVEKKSNEIIHASAVAI